MTAPAGFPSGLWIGGRWVTPADTLPVRNPATGGVLARAPLGGPAELESAAAAAAGAFPAVRDLPPHRRAAILLAVARGLGERRSELAATLCAEAGKPITLAETEVERAIVTFTAAAEEARRTPGEMLDLDAFPAGQGCLGWVRRFPVGVIYGLTPFNFPLNLAAHKIAPALATGNTLVLKPSPRTPLTPLLLAGVLEEAGVPPGQVNVVTCPDELAGRLAEDARVAMVSFTGGAAAGWALRERAGRRRVVLELGGNAAVIVHGDADLDAAVPAIAASAFAYAGQSCISAQRLLVHEPVYEEFRARLLAEVRERMPVGDPTRRETRVGPLIDEAAAARVGGWLEAAVRAGATLLCGGRVRGAYVEPAVVENADPGLDLCAREVFGPVVTLHRYGEFEEALAQVNASAYGLQAGVFTRDLQRAFRAHQALEVGGVLVNLPPSFRVENMPYGGVKDSGCGREGIRAAMHEMTEPRSLLVKPG
ncbi:MAG: Succinate semialdehyde dehydrogenase [Verrucomicrobiota bacterium]